MLLFGGLCIVTFSYIGAWIAARFRLPAIYIRNLDFRWLLVPAIGILTLSVAAGFTISLGSGTWSGVTTALLLTLAIADSKALIHYWRSVSIPIAPLVLFVATATTQALLLALLQHSPYRGDDIFWTIYGLTKITPGDSPQSYLQAQYLVHGSQGLLGLANFSIFDRPFLGGVITASALCAVDQCPSINFGNPSGIQANLYVSLWIWLNTLCVIGIWSLVAIFANTSRRTSIALLLIISPFIVFNSIGLWPKQFALYLIICAVFLSAVCRFPAAIILSSFAFTAHGSFLWAHISFSFGALVYLITSPTKTSISEKMHSIWMIMFLTVIAPIAWFWGERICGAATPPLRAFYLYDTYSVNAALHEPIDKLAGHFYQATHFKNLILLPIINVIKSLLPTELLHELLHFSYRSNPYTFSEFFKSLYDVNFNRPLFAFGFIFGILGINSIIRYWKRYWELPAAVIIFFVLPLLPGAALYRHDDYFLLIIMMFTLIPLIIAITLYVKNLTKNIFMLLSFAIAFEYMLVYLFRFQPIGYEGEFINWYHLAIITFLGSAWIFTLWQEIYINRVNSNQAALSTNDVILNLFNFKLPIHCACTSIIVLTIIIMISLPVLLLRVLNDGGFSRYGESADLLTWPNILVTRNKDAYIHPNVKIEIGGKSRNVVWINSGQSVKYQDITIGKTSHLKVAVAIVPAFYDGGAQISDVHFEILINTGKECQLVSRTTINPTKRAEDKDWHEIFVDISAYAGSVSDIIFTVVSDQKGIWTAWADPLISP